ncbi:phytanoyl-CoA dioxygenase family protein [Agilicoccus flavus]|uniref:phytanoyl-CoA dioxygenase family protein n=1 Tax=Agilicoccus flavus TaxID=2775968 RepID=UPI001CF71412|nr:phytanoyl-CoA dioxygenase family protein [Agilicoccus flavus]
MSAPAYFAMDSCRVEDLVALVEEGLAATRADDYPHAEGLVEGVLTYDATRLRAVADTDAVRAELARALSDGPGIVVLAGAFDAATIDETTAAFQELIAAQRAAGHEVGDHFAKPGANDRVWNALEKLAVARPETFVRYYANDMLALAATAWLGPDYQVTSQVNVVNPGGTRQDVHRDYHLGFLSADRAARFPTHVHGLSPALTLQGAVAHVDMPVESGPTLYLPHSHRYAPGYLAWWLEPFKAHFDRHHVQLPLRKGDAVFFNPALFHAAGTNHSADILRMANLLQVSSAFGRAMETVDRRRVVEAIYPALLAARTAGDLDEAAAHRVVAASAEGYPFPTNLDLDPPVGGRAPASQADHVRAALASAASPPDLATTLAAYEARRV